MLSNLLLLFFSCSYLVSTAQVSGSCGDFQEGACDLSEDNIIGHDRFTNTAAECQAKCRDNPSCSFFTHFSTQCYLLSQCGDSAHCEGCVSGPTYPDFGTCPWPPSPDTTTAATTSTTTKSTTTTTKPTTPKTTHTTTKPTTATTESTTTKPTTTKPTTTKPTTTKPS